MKTINNMTLYWVSLLAVTVWHIALALIVFCLTVLPTLPSSGVYKREIVVKIIPGPFLIYFLSGCIGLVIALIIGLVSGAHTNAKLFLSKVTATNSRLGASFLNNSRQPIAANPPSVRD